MTLLTRRTFMAATLGTIGGTTLGLSALADGHSAAHTVIIKGHKFVPENLTIAAGDTVNFVNEDGARHTATENNGSFDTGRLGRGDSAALTFPSSGEFSYFCKFHRSMTGSITVG